MHALHPRRAGAALVVGTVAVVIAMLLAATAGCGDPSPIEPVEDSGTVDGATVDGAAIDTPDVAIDGGIDARIDAPIDAPIDTPPLPRWGLTFPGEEALDVATVGNRTYLLTRPSSGPMRLRTIVGEQVTTTETLVQGSGRLDTDGQSLYVQLGFYGAGTLWGEATGTAGVNTIVVAKLDTAGQPSWRHVDSTSVSYVAAFDVGANGTSAFVLVRNLSNSYVNTLYVLSASGAIGHTRILPSPDGIAIDATGKVFASGTLYEDDSLDGHTALTDESYLLKLVGGNVSFSRFGAVYSQQVIGVHDGDPILAGRTSDGGRTIARHSGASGSLLWTTRFDGGGNYFIPYMASDGGGSLHLFGTFADRIDFTPALRFETAGDPDLYVAELDAVSGVVRGAHHLGSAEYDFLVQLEPGVCPLVGGTLRGPLTHGQGELSVPVGTTSGAFVATACF